MTTAYAVPRPKPPPPVRPVQNNDGETALAALLLSGFWYCLDGEHICERIERENGLAAMCSRCGSIRLEYQQPAF